MVRGKNVLKYETPFKGPYEMIQTWSSGTVTIQTGAITDRLNIRRVKPYKIMEVS